ncbi:unnamed protein product [Blepharisma stoltei]|uniref:protein-tyrosine-phosphatase n=1 Tax=Blepharisma stoltei TaxID=1481888 RepID=A0AAU9INC0_9CILI|nr:unnamed protein product [Blepharisma stoltei]
MYSIDFIDEGLYIGNKLSAGKFELLKRTGITHILIVGNNLEPEFPICFHYKRINVWDDEKENLRKHFPECNSWIENAIQNNGKVLVHCSQGISRSCAVVTAYLMYKKKFTAINALQYVKDRHRDSNPNIGFIKQLQVYEKNIGPNSNLMANKIGCSCVTF